MTTGDEPMLPQPSDDNAPMISGRGTKIIADARGAYLVGNLSALIERMDESQQVQFRQAIVRQTLSVMERTNSQMQLEWVERLIQIAREWLIELAPDRELALSNILAEHGIIDLDEPDYILDDADSSAADLYWCITAPLPDASAGALIAVLTCAELFGNNLEQADEIATQWQLDAAWAIMQGEEPPPLPELPS